MNSILLSTYVHSPLGVAALLVGLLSSTAIGAQGGVYSSTPEYSYPDLGATSGLGDLNGDGHDDFIIGQPSNNPGGVEGAGSVYLFSGKTGAVLFELHGTTENAEFGRTVAGVGDVNGDGVPDFSVGAPGTDHNGHFRAGSAYLYSGATASLLMEVNGDFEYSHFGFKVAGAGDVNNDGLSDWMMSGHIGSGRIDNVFVFAGGSGAILHQFTELPESGWFGSSISSAGDVDGDGHSDLLIGDAFTDQNGLTNAGTAYVFSGASGVQLHQFEGTLASGYLSQSAASAGDVDGDGFSDLILGAPYASNNKHPYAGVAYVYSGATGALLYEFWGNRKEAHLGGSVAGIGDLNQDGFDDLLIGAPATSAAPPNDLGAVYVLSGATGRLTHHINGRVPNDHFGRNAVSAGDVNGDGYPDILFTGSTGAYVHTFFPSMTSTISQLSAANGGMFFFEIDFPVDAAFDEYKILMSLSGIGPTKHGIQVPLTYDPLVQQTYIGNYPFFFHANMWGVLDSNGDALATALVPQHVLQPLVGRTIYCAAIANKPGDLPEFSTVAVQIEITL